LALPSQPDELIPEWREIRAELRRLVGESAFDIWLAPLEVKAWDGVVLLLHAPAPRQRWVAARFGRIIERCARATLGAGIRVDFAGGQERGRHQARRDDGGDLLAKLDRVTSLNPRYSFDQFIIGRTNHLAHGASLAVAEHPGQAYNPLFLHAPPGLGKTHLLHAIGNYILAFGGGASVRYTTVEAFTNHFITALNTRSLDGFKRAYRDVDVLLIDDVQFLVSKAKTEEEFFHTFNALHENGRQLVLTCDRLPRQLAGVEERLRERFESGLVADIDPPDYATRIAILRKRAALDRIALEDVGVLELIAERITDNVRALEGALIRIVAHHSLTNQPLDTALARTVLDGMYPPAATSVPPIAHIQATVASYYDVTREQLLSSTREARIAWPRQVAIHLAREHTRGSLHELGEAFGGRNHATVIHACKRVAERITSDPEAAQDVDKLGVLIRSHHPDRSY
jgi:chromosomal replication initiator protein